MKILLVDDEQELVSALAERLSFRGVAADWTTSGEEALRMARKGEYEVAVLDVKMPGIGGLELCRRLEAVRPGMRYIFLSGHGSMDDFRAGSTLASSYLVKPVNIDELVARINEARGAERQDGGKKA